MNENVKRAKLDQRRAPIHEALEKFRNMRVVPFDVPGHKRGRGNPELAAFLGQQCVGLDVNSMKPLDNLCHPVSVIREAEELAADAFGAAHAFLMVGGTTSSVQSMVLTACKRGDEIILPRNVHRSVMGAMVLCGAVPVYVNPECDERLGIPLGMKLSEVEKAIEQNPDAKAVLVNNPTYYGICSDLRGIVALAHRHGMKCLVDEAHGTHLYFGENMPVDVVVRPEDWYIFPDSDASQLSGIVTSSIFKGVHYEMVVEANGYEFIVQDYHHFAVGEQVGLLIKPFDIHIMKKERVCNTFEGELTDGTHVEFLGCNFECAPVTDIAAGAEVRVEVGFDKIILQDNEEDGTLTGEVKFILYKGDHYHLTVWSDWDENVFVDTNDVWDDGDRVGITIPPDAIRVIKK